MYNKKLLKNITDGLDKAKKPKAAKDIIYDPKGQWKHPGEVTRIPSSSITMKGVGYPVLGVPNKGAPSMMQPNQDYNFPNADYVDEYPHMDGGGQIYTYAARPGSYYKKDVNEGMARKGGSLKSKKYTKNLDGTNYLFAESSLFKKPKKLSKKRIFHPHAKYYKTGGESGCPEGYAFNPVTGECVEWDPEVWESEEQPTSYDPIGDVIYMNPNDRPEGMSDEEYQQMYQDQLEHEQLHRLQWVNGDLKGRTGTPLRMPSTVDNQEYNGDHYYNRRSEDESDLGNYWMEQHPNEANFIPGDVLYDKVIDPAMYEVPWTTEGEARGYEGAVHNGMESLFPKRKKGGALLTKKVTCKKCGWTWDAADGGDDITTCHKCGGQGLVHAQDGGENEPWNPDYEQPSTYEFQPLSAEQIAQREFEQEQERLRQEEERFRLEQETWTPEQWDEYRIKEEARKYQQALINEPKYFDEGIQFVKDWHNSPMYNQMVLNSYKGDQKSADYVTKLRKQNIDSIPSLNIVNSRTTKYGASAPMAWSFNDSGQIEVFPGGFESGPSTYVHEGLHSSDRPRGSFKGSGANYPSWMLYKDPRFPNEDVWFDRTIPLSDQKYITKNRSADYKDSEAYNIALKEDPINFKAPSDEEIKNEIIAEGISPDDPKFQTTFNKYKKWYTDDVKTYVKGFKENWKEYGHDYVSQPTEVRARLGEFRYYAKKAGIYDPFTEQLTPETYQKFINTYKDDKNEDAIRSVDDLREQYTDEEIMWLLNNISKTNDSAKELDVASEGGSFELDLTPEEIQEYAKGGYIVEDISVPSLNQAQVGGPQGPPLLVNNALLTSNQKIAAAAHASPTRENAAKLQSLKDQKVKEEADKAARIAAYKKKQAEEKAKAEGIARWYEEEKKRRAEEEVLFGNNGVQASDATRVDTGYLSPLVGIAKREEQDKKNQEDKIYNSQQNAIKKGYKNIYEYENDPMGAKWDQAQANEAAWLQSGAERPMVNTGEMGYNKGFTNDKSGWDPITKKYYTKTGIYDPKTKKWKPNPSYFKGSGAIQSVDEVWAAPIAIPVALEGIGALAALEIPGLGATVGQAVNAGFVAHGVSKLPETGGAWYDAYKSGTGDYRDAIEKTFWNALDFAGAGELKSPLKLQAATAEKALAETPLQKFIGKTGVTAEEIANTHVDDFDSMAFTDDFDNLFAEGYIQDDLAEAFRRIENRSNQLPAPPNELYIDPVHLEPALAGDGSKAALVAERDWLMDEYKSLGLENYDNYINDAPHDISQRASELEAEITALNNRLRTQVQNATTSSPAAADIMNFRNQPGYINSTEQAVNEIPFLSDEALNVKYNELTEEQIDLMFNTGNVPMTPEAQLRYEEVNNILRDLSRERNHRAAVDNAFTTRVQLPVDEIEEFAHNPFAGLRGEREIEVTPLRRDTALRINSNVVPGTGGRTVAETLAMHDNPLNAMIDVRRFAQEGIIGENSAADLMTSLRQEIKKMPIKGDEKKFFIKEAKRISNVPKDVPYTGSALTDRELDKLMTAIPLEERTAIFDKYGYTVDDLIQFDGKYGANDQLMNVAQNQVYDDIRYLRDHGIPNPNPPVINFKTGEISELLQNESELANIGLSEETLNTINETRYHGTLNEQRVKPKTSGVVEYNYVEEQQIHKLKDPSIIPETKDLDKLIKSYEEAVSKLKDGDIKDALTTQLEDYKSTKWLRTEYADELKAQGLTPSEIEKASIISNHGGRKNIIDGKGNVVGTLNAYAAKTYEGTKGFKIGSTGVNYKFHPYNLKHSKFKSWDKAQEYFEKQVFEKNLATITNEADKSNPIMLKHLKRQAKVKAEELVKQLQDNNNNRWGEALYRGVHHGVKDTKGPVFTDKHFVSTSLPDAFTGTRIERYRAEDYWNSQMKQLNELGVPKAASVQMPSTHAAYSQYDLNDLNNLPPTNLVIKRKQGGDIDKLNKFIY